MYEQGVSAKTRSWSETMVRTLKHLSEKDTYIEDIAIRMKMPVTRIQAKMIQHGFHIIRKPKA